MLFFSTKYCRKLFFTALLGGTILYCAPVAASTDPPSRDKLLGLAAQFVSKVETGFEKADSLMEKRVSTDDRMQKYFDAIPDEELLLLQIQLDSITIDRSIIAIKRGHDVMISFSDFVAAVNFPIAIDPEAGTAKGWFVRENQPFDLDVSAGTVHSKDANFRVSEGEAIIEDNDILIKGSALAQWMDFNLKINAMNQSARISKDQKWPLEEKIAREDRARKNYNVRLGPPKQPRQETPYSIASVPNVDIYARHKYSDPGSSTGKISRSADYNVRMAGDLLGHTAKTVMLATNTDHITSARTEFKKTSDEPDLLGKFKAREYSFMDVEATSVPFTGSSGIETGFRVTNKDPYVTYNTVTEISGDSIPGWDVELYRNSQYIDLRTTDDNGRFTFDDVLLFSGDNHFRIVQYGPQGEVREENRTISVRRDLYNAEGGAYDVSLTAQNHQLYRQFPSNDPDRNTPHLAATYERQLTQDLALRTGMRVREENREQKTYVHAGLVNVIDNTVINADTAADDDGAWTAALTARHRFDKHDLFASIKHESEDYNPNENLRDPSRTKLNFAARGPLPDYLGKRPTYGLQAEYLEQGDGSGRQRLAGSVTTKLGPLSFNNRVQNKVTWQPDGSDSEGTDGVFAVHGNLFHTNWRAVTDYELYPEEKINGYTLDLNRKINPNLQADLEINYAPAADITSGELGLTWQGEHILMTPTLTYDSMNNIGFVLRSRTGLGYDPYTNQIAMSGKTMSDKGGVSARVFLDRDGNNKFDPWDQLLDGVTVEAPHSRVYAITDEKGEAFLFNLPTTKITDVRVQEGSVFDPTWIPGSEGVSVRPRPGHVEQVDFPVHISGEIDGTAYIRTEGTKPRIAKNIILHLFDGEGRLIQSTQTAPDGFYLLTRIPPGDYLLMADEKSAKNSKLVRPLPQQIHIGYEGTIIYSNDIYFSSGADDVGFTLATDLGDYPDINPAFDVTGLHDKAIILNFGDYNSRLLMSVMWYKLRARYGNIVNGLKPLVSPAESYASLDSGMHSLRARLPGYNLEDAWYRCRALMARGIYCRIEALPAGLQKEASAPIAGRG